MKSWVQLYLSVAMTSALLVVGCGDDDGAVAVRLGDEGESCVRTGDCKTGLSCINNFCAMSGMSGAGGDDAGAGAGGSTGPALGGEGESCQARRDCSEGLQCIEQRCTVGGAAGSGGAPAPRLGSRGESCQVVSDCVTGLVCLPREYGSICDLEDFGLTPTGKVCGGECATASDCCELPTTLGFGSCENLVQTYLGGNVATSCPNSGPLGGLETYCFYYRTYCACGANTWSCDSNKCTYTAACTTSGATWGGCPAVTRLNLPTPTSTCGTNDRCEVAAGCETPDDCAVSSDTQATCTGDACTCYQSSCYVKCDEDLDCQFGYVCNTTSDVCERAPACVSNEQCAASLADATAECRGGQCTLPCQTDQDCSDSGTLGGGGAFNQMVCNADHVCEQLGCSSDDECNNGFFGNLRTFCVDAAAMAPTAVRSAITD